MSQAYRPDISGLRAFAVLAVLLFHLDLPLISGGFVGVDVFFVISGFLIAKQVYTHLESGPTTAMRFLAWFYERRARRILPAMMFVSALTFLAAYVLFLPDRFTQFAWSLAASTAFSANIYFWLTSDYFAAAAHTQPLLHYWSLGVEEHFYFVFPILVLGLWRFGIRALSLVLVLISIASLAASELALSTMPDSVFYLVQFRAWELLCGSLLALPFVRGPASGVIAIAAALAGLTILTGSVSLTDVGSFPGLAAAPACLASVLLIWAGSRRNAVSDVIGNHVLDYIGRISYSLYLVHWPVIVFTKHLYPTITQLNLTSVALPISFALAALSYHLVESPTRSRRGVWTPPRIAMLSTGGLVVSSALAAMVILSGGLASRLPDDVRALTSYTYDFRTAYREGTCFLRAAQTFDDLDRDVCLPDGERLAVLWGDSYAAHYVPSLRPRIEAFGYTFAQANSATCAPIIARIHPRVPNCHVFNDEVMAWIKQNKPSVVIMSALWPVDQKSIDQFAGTLRELEKVDGLSVVILGSSPLYFETVPTILAARRLRADRSDFATTEVRKQSYQGDEKIGALAAGMPTATYISVMNTGCPNRVCRINAVEPFHWDNGHMTTAGSGYFVDAFLPQLNSVLAR